ncbi:HEPN domain-containing protein [Candidatus Poribacteria bacterium]|nr:HEPN domain-containing protein [Candidatus Poribacteria bacterium]
MNPLTLEWMQKAEKDYAAVEWLQQAPIPDYDIICFHIQQCIEKYLKAWLQEANIPIPRSHDLKELLALIVPTVPLWQVWEPDFSEISKHAVATRYPGDSATVDNAAHALQICDQVRHAIREHLKLPSDSL